MENHVLEFTCTGIENGGIFPVKNTGCGLDVSPEFVIKNLSADAQTIAITIDKSRRTYTPKGKYYQQF